MRIERLMPGSTGLRRLVTVVGSGVVAVVALAQGFGAAAQTAPPPAFFGSPPTQAPACPAPGPNHDYSGKTLRFCNFARAQLAGANFSKATLMGVVFDGADLSGATFDHAVIADSGRPELPTDFSFANLRQATLTNMTVKGRVYFTYADLTCASFALNDASDSKPPPLDLTSPMIVMGSPLKINAAGVTCANSARTSFAGVTMSCDFMGQWNQLDLTGANVQACASALTTPKGGSGYDFSGGLYSGVRFDGLDLTASRWTGAVLEGTSFQGATLDNATGFSGSKAQRARLSNALFTDASAQNVDFSYAQLYGAKFTYANLTNANFEGAYLISNKDGQPKALSPADFTGAHLQNASLVGAELEGVTFEFASLYSKPAGVAGTTAGLSCGLSKSSTSPCPHPTGATCHCATVAGANLTGTDFGSAYLYGVDFSGATLNGTKFGSAVLVGSNFSGVQFGSNGEAQPSSFNNAMLQGTVFDAQAALQNANFAGAFLDFGAPGNPYRGNTLYLQLSQNYAKFPNGPLAQSTPCVIAAYGQFSQVPSASTLICANGVTAACGSGSSAASRAYWSNVMKGSTTGSGIGDPTGKAVAGWYLYDATYDAATTGTCTSTNRDVNW